MSAAAESLARAEREGAQWRSFVYWCPVEVALPERAGKYVVEIDAGFDMCYLSTRSFNPENPPENRWLNTCGGERVSHWLAGLRSVTECIAAAALGGESQ